MNRLVTGSSYTVLPPTSWDSYVPYLIIYLNLVEESDRDIIRGMVFTDNEWKMHIFIEGEKSIRWKLSEGKYHIENFYSK